MAAQDMAGGPCKTATKNGAVVGGDEEAHRRGVKSTSVKRLLLNKCQEAFETDDIYAEVSALLPPRDRPFFTLPRLVSAVD